MARSWWQRWLFRRCGECRTPLGANAVQVGWRAFCSPRHARAYANRRAWRKAAGRMGGGMGGRCC